MSRSCEVLIGSALVFIGALATMGGTILQLSCAPSEISVNLLIGACLAGGGVGLMAIACFLIFAPWRLDMSRNIENTICVAFIVVGGILAACGILLLFFNDTPLVGNTILTAVSYIISGLAITASATILLLR